MRRASLLMRSLGISGPMTQLPLEEQAPLKHRIAERRREKDSRHLSQFIVHSTAVGLVSFLASFNRNTARKRYPYCQGYNGFWSVVMERQTGQKSDKKPTTIPLHTCQMHANHRSAARLPTF